MVHSSAMEIRPDGCDNQPFGKLRTHYILENQCTYVYLDVFICWIIFCYIQMVGISVKQLPRMSACEFLLGEELWPALSYLVNEG